MIFKKKNDLIIVRKKNRDIAVIKKDTFKYVFFNNQKLKFKVNICLKDNNFIYILVDSCDEAFEMITDIKKQLGD